MVRKAPIGVLKDQLLVRSLESYARYLPTAFDKENFAFYGTTLSGTPEQEARWKRAVNFTVGALGDDVSKLYVERYYRPKPRPRPTSWSRMSSRRWAGGSTSSTG